VRWDVRSAYDFLFSLSNDAGSTDDLPAEDRAWLTKSKEALRGQVGDELELYATEFCILLAGLAVDRPDVTDAAGFLRLLNQTSVADVVALIVHTYFHDPDDAELAARALEAEEAAIGQLLTRARDHGHDKVERFGLLFRTPEKLVDPARNVLVHWLPFYAEVEPRVRAMLQRDYEQRAGDRATLEAGELIEKTTGGIRWLSEPGIRRVILAPSYFARPYNFVLGVGDWRMYGYPIADSALDATDPLAPPQSVLRLHRALGDDTRLRILRLLRDQDYYLTEIAERLELSKPTIKHHLAMLRSAGLVTLVEEGGLSYYSLRRERLDDASSELKRFLVGPS
jgi:DNA-binding transcriptional ArsR family regulator